VTAESGVPATDAAQLYQAFIGNNPAEAIRVVEHARAQGIEQKALYDAIYAPALALLGGAWANGSLDEMAFAQAAVVAEQIGSFVMPPPSLAGTGVSVVIGSMHRDFHSIARTIIGATLKEAGHRVTDIGVDARPTDFLERIEEGGARIVIVVAEMIETAHAVQRLRELLTGVGREDVVMLVSGGPFAADESLAREVGANGVVLGAESALKLVARAARDLESRGREVS